MESRISVLDSFVSTFRSAPVHSLNTVCQQTDTQPQRSASPGSQFTMCTVIISALSHFFTQQLSHKNLSGTVGSQLQYRLYKTVKQLCFMKPRNTRISTLNVRQDALYTFLAAESSARFILFSLSASSESSKLMYLTRQERRTDAEKKLQRSRVKG